MPTPLTVVTASVKLSWISFTKPMPLEEYLCVLPLDDNNAVFNLCCRLCSAYECKAFRDGLQCGAELILELGKEAAR